MLFPHHLPSPSFSKETVCRETETQKEAEPDSQPLFYKWALLIKDNSALFLLVVAGTTDYFHRYFIAAYSIVIQTLALVCR